MSRRSHVADPPSKIEIPITPILDLSFQLLFFFVVTYNPVEFVEGDIDMSLPQAKKEEAAQKPPDTPPPSPKEIKPDLSVNLTIVVKTANNPAVKGTINQIFTETEGEPMKSLPFSSDPNNNNRLDLSKLQERLLAAKKRMTKKQKEVVKLKADPDLRLGDLVQIMDACKDPAKGLNFELSFVQPVKAADRP